LLFTNEDINFEYQVYTGWAMNSLSRTIYREQIRKDIHQPLLKLLKAMVILKDNPLYINDIGMHLLYYIIII
jgi:hypothetical protein